MAENQGVSAFPLPPSKYVNMYTDENVKRGRAPLPPPPIQVCYYKKGMVTISAKSLFLFYIPFLLSMMLISKVF